MASGRVLHLITSLNIGGTERYLLALCKAQSTRYDCRVGFMKVEGPVAEELRAAGVPVDRTPSTSRIHKLIRMHRPDYLHTHLYRANVVGRLVGAAAGVPVIISSQHDIGAWCSFYHRWMDRWSSRFADCIVADSEAAMQALIRRTRIEPGRIRVIHSCAVEPKKMKSGLSRTDARARLGLSAGNPVFGCVARLHESKGVQYLPAIARELIRTLPSAKILVAGDGPLRNRLEQDIRDAGVSENLRLLGWREDVPDVLAALDVFFLPSVEESFPRTILEALTAGCPVVATDVGGVSEIISDGQHGVLVPPGDPAAMCRQLIFTYEHRDEACRMAARGQSRVTTEFTLEHMLSQTQALYDELKAKKGLS